MAGYAPLNTAYIKVLMTRISFVVKVTQEGVEDGGGGGKFIYLFAVFPLQNPEISPTLIFDDKPFTVPTDIDHA